MEICPAGAEIFHAEGQRYRQTRRN